MLNIADLMTVRRRGSRYSATARGMVRVELGIDHYDLGTGERWVPDLGLDDSDTADAREDQARQRLVDNRYVEREAANAREHDPRYKTWEELIASDRDRDRPF